MTSLKVRDFRVNALISHRRGSNHALMLGGESSTLLLIGCRWVFALRDALVNRIEAVPGPKQKPREISAAPIVQLTAHA